MAHQLELLKPEHRVPATTKLSGRVIDGFHIITASDLETAQHAITFARVTGSIGSNDYHYECASPEQHIQGDAEIIKWARVIRVDQLSSTRVS